MDAHYDTIKSHNQTNNENREDKENSEQSHFSLHGFVVMQYTR